MLCSVDIAVIIFGSNKKLYEYSSGDMSDILGRYNYVGIPPYNNNPEDVLTVLFSMRPLMSIKARQTFKGKEGWTMMTMIWTWAHPHRIPKNT